MEPVAFADSNFQLACLDVLFDAGHFTDDVRRITESVDPGDGFGPSPDRLREILGLSIGREQLDEIETFGPDGGDDVYFHVMPDWDGTGPLSIGRFDDLRLLPNLKHLAVSAMAEEASLDLRLLLAMPKLESLETDSFFVLPESIDAIDQLRSRGVEVTVTG